VFFFFFRKGVYLDFLISTVAHMVLAGEHGIVVKQRSPCERTPTTLR